MNTFNNGSSIILYIFPDNHKKISNDNIMTIKNEKFPVLNIKRVVCFKQHVKQSRGLIRTQVLKLPIFMTTIYNCYCEKLHTLHGFLYKNLLQLKTMTK